MMEQITKKQIEDVKSFVKGFVLEYNIEPILVMESGSRMWEFASQDSDFDIRGIFLFSKTDMYSIKKQKEQFDKIDDLMDIVMFSIDKYFNLLGSSNPNFLERLQSPIVYLNKLDEFGIDLKEFRENVYKYVNLKKLYYHYISMAHNNYDKYIKSDNLFTYKKCLYVLRSLFCTEYILQKKSVPPVVFRELISNINIDKKYLDLIYLILDKKDKSEEKTEVENKEEVKKLIEAYFQKVENEIIEDTGDTKKLIEYLNSVAVKVKEKYYK